MVHPAQSLALHHSTEMPMKRAITKATTSFLRIFFHPPATSSSRPSSASHGISVFNGCCWVSPSQSYPILSSPCERQTPSRQAGKSSHNSTQHLIEALKVRLNHTNPTQLRAGCQKRHNLSPVPGALPPPTLSPCHIGRALALALETQPEFVELP